MRDSIQFTLFGLDETDRVLAQEILSAADIDAARGLARERLRVFPRVEVWSNWVCVYRGRRQLE